ncbi:Flavin reductase like domain protein [Hartmannibacter diazotrophicus]|uniref:Flavin reductase like domain protein n=1 Tax=Hartmannibacter diazotrophicus TaxID=1482074 RepID=A0A2C9D7D6_9HYPH|nr:flavin reductase family protein [Hartmannibacter diazotrophicus]SON55445.1 Flavin reductase like domain protein [Hartmannibacter diazotrophicus]
MFYDPRENDHGLPHDPFYSLVLPRPIGWISSLSPSGVRNLAPYSFFNAFSTNPYVVGFSSTGRKDSLANIEATGAFVCNLATDALRESMNASSAVVGPEVDEFELAGLTPVASQNVPVPRVGESPAALECIHTQTIPIADAEGKRQKAFLVLGEVVGIHIDEAALKDGRVDVERIRPIARLGYQDYAVVDRVFSMKRPSA